MGRMFVGPKQVIGFGTERQRWDHLNISHVMLLKGINLKGEHTDLEYHSTPSISIRRLSSSLI
jgi:hypothetical protein